jgi:hypothetical protein
MAERIDPTAQELQGLDECRDAIDTLSEENAQLRDAAGAFGDLAERLSTALREDRRRHPRTDRRGALRRQSDRRATGVASGVESA